MANNTQEDRRIAQLFRDVARQQQIPIRQQGNQLIIGNASQIRYPLNRSTALATTIARSR